METRSRKRAEASSVANSSSDTSSSQSAFASANTIHARPPSKRARLNVWPSSVIATRSQLISNSAAATDMDSSSNADSFASRSRREPGSRRGSVKSRTIARNRDLFKGKDKALEFRASDRSIVRDRDADMSVGMGTDEGDDEDTDGGDGILHDDLNSAGTALQGLLRKLGAGFDDLLPPSFTVASSSHQNGRLKKILSGLQADGEEGRQVDALTQLCDTLSISTEDSLSTFSVESFVPVLVGLLNHESNADIMLLAGRALTHLCDVLPSSCTAVVHYGAVSCFCARLLTIEYMDLAEQSLQALKKISQEHPAACLRAGALMAVLSYIDFFSTGVQRVALSTAANMCKKIPSDAADVVMEAVPLLTNLLHYHDSKVLDHASVCFVHIAEAFASSSEKLDKLCNHGLLGQAVALISISSSGQASLSTSTYTGLIRLLSTCARGSLLGAKTLLLLGISGTLKDILPVSGPSLSPASARPPEQVFEIVNLVDELLPPLPQGLISLPLCPSFLMKGTITKKSSGSVSGKLKDTNGPVHVISAREKLLQDQPELLQQFGMDLFPILIQIYGSSVNGPVRHRCLFVIGKLMYFSTADMIKTLLKVTNIGSFLAGILACKDPQVLVPTLQIAEILMEKLPATFSKMFVREGVVHAVEMLITLEPSNAVIAEASIIEREKDSLQGISSRSRRYQRRRGGGLNSDGNSLKELSTLSGSNGLLPTSIEVQSSNSNIHAVIGARARAFKETYFPVGPGTGTSEFGVTDGILLLKKLCKELNTCIEDFNTRTKGKSKASGICFGDVSSATEEQLIGVISDMLMQLSKGDGISTFEFIGSGVINALLNYFSCGTFSKEKISEVQLPKLRQHGLRRFQSFIAVSLPVNVEGHEAPMTVLVQKLQNALDSLESFPVVFCHASSHSSRPYLGKLRLSSGSFAVTEPLKLRLCRAKGDKSLRDFSSNIMLIEPIATLASIEEFLWPKIQQRHSGRHGNSDSRMAPITAGASSPTTFPASSGCDSTRSKSSLTGGGTRNDSHGQGSSSKRKGKAVLKSTHDESNGPQTRNAVHRRASIEKDSYMKFVRRDSSSEDNLDYSLDDIDDTSVIDEDISADEDGYDHDEVLHDDIITVSPAKLHDVKLGQLAEDITTASATRDAMPNPTGSTDRSSSVRGMASNEFMTSLSFGSKGSLSFAAAAMSGLTSSSGRGLKGVRDHRMLPLSGSNDSSKLIFSAGGKRLSRNLTVYQAIQHILDCNADEGHVGSHFSPEDCDKIWSETYTITYHKAGSPIGRPQTTSLTSKKKIAKSIGSSIKSSEAHRQQISLLNRILQGELPCDLEKSDPTYNILALLRVLEGLNQLAPYLRVQIASDNFSEGKTSSFDEVFTPGPKIHFKEFINSKLTPKFARQIQDALTSRSNSLPSWCYQLTKACPFLFPFETRRQYFYLTACGLSRALLKNQQHHGADNYNSTAAREIRIERMNRQKVRVYRNRILDSALKVMEMYSGQDSILEVEYFDEIGTGLGPTLEFYTLLSHDLQKAGLHMWRSNSSPNESSVEIDIDEHQQDKKFDGMKMHHNCSAGLDFVQAPLGLFPRPWHTNADASEGSQFSKVIEYFRMLGQVMAKALQDGRIMDLPLSVAFYKLVLGHELNLHDIVSFDMEFGKILQEMHALASRKLYMESMGSNYLKEISYLSFRGTPLEDLCIDFTLPGYPDYVLKAGEENTLVDINSLEEYVSLAVDATVNRGIMPQMEAFRAGFNLVFDITSLEVFSPDELDYLLCGSRELWDAETLADHIKFDHGYTAKSPQIINLLEILGEFKAEQKRAFCQFVTGSPRLPPGGLAVLNPKLTIVRKHSSNTTKTATNGTEASESADHDLPSVMTCANYLKLPPYSTKELMYKKLLYAISEGQGSFDLS